MDTIPAAQNESESTASANEHQKHSPSADRGSEKAPYDKENSWLRPMLRVYANVDSNVRTMDVRGDHYQLEKGRPTTC